MPHVLSFLGVPPPLRPSSSSADKHHSGTCTIVWLSYGSGMSTSTVYVVSGMDNGEVSKGGVGGGGSVSHDKV